VSYDAGKKDEDPIQKHAKKINAMIQNWLSTVSGHLKY
jgi:hypothetical protein